MHLVSADLDLDRLAAGSDDGRVDRAVEIVLGGGDVVVELAGNELPQRVDDPKRGIAFGDRVDQHPCRADIHELIEGEVLGLHFAPDAVDVLRPALDGGLDAGGAQLRLQRAFQLLDVALALGAARLERGRDVLVLGGLQIAEREVFELPFQLPHAEPVGERRVDLAGFDGELALGRRVQPLAARIFCSCSARRTTTRRTSPIMASSILRSASACPVSRPRSGVQSGGNPKWPSCAERARQAHRLRAEAPFGAFTIEVPGIEQRLQHGGQHDVIVGIQGPHDLRHVEGNTAGRFGGRR